MAVLTEVVQRHVTAGCKSRTVPKRHQHVPELVVGFDTETTGLSVTSDRAISYGFSAYRYGVAIWSEHYFVIPDCPISEGARRVHGLSVEDLHALRGIAPVYGPEAGVARCVELLGEVARQGGVVVGANVVRFDLEMLRRSANSLLNLSLEAPPLDLTTLDVIDVVEHDLAIEPSREVRPRRGLTQLCLHYGVTPGGHDALGDARAAVEVFVAQVARNNAGQISFHLPVEERFSPASGRIGGLGSADFFK